MEGKQLRHFSAATCLPPQDGLSLSPHPAPGTQRPQGSTEGGAGKILHVCSGQQKSTLAFWKDKSSRGTVCQLSRVCYSSMELPAVSPVPAMMLRATPDPQPC